MTSYLPQKANKSIFANTIHPPQGIVTIVGPPPTGGSALVQTGTLSALVQTGTLSALIQTGSG